MLNPTTENIKTVYTGVLNNRWLIIFCFLCFLQQKNSGFVCSNAMQFHRKAYASQSITQTVVHCSLSAYMHKKKHLFYFHISAGSSHLTPFNAHCHCDNLIKFSLDFDVFHIALFVQKFHSTTFYCIKSSQWITLN